jgi:Helix-turn-helix of DDE superfamily endonuclease
MSCARLSRKPLLFKSFTGLAVPEFDVISKEIESKYNEHERRRRLSNRKRKRDVGAGRPFKLKLRERFLMLLVYYRLYITFTLSGFLFDLDQSNVYRDISILEPLIKLCVPLPKKLYKRTRRARTIDEVEGYFPGFKAFVDLLNRKYQGQRTKEEGRVTIRVKRRNILSRHNLWSIVMAPYYTKLVMSVEENMIMRFSKIIILRLLCKLQISLT